MMPPKSITTKRSAGPEKVEWVPVATVDPYDDSKMNLVFSSTWNLCDAPTVQTVRDNPYMNPAEYPRMELAAAVNPFVLLAPMPLDSNEFVEIPFAGGTLHDLLRQIHRFYQEPVSLDDVALLLETAMSQDEKIRYSEHQEEILAGCIVRRIDLLDCQDARFGSIENDYLIAWLD
jgi:hypothetical protein